MYFFQFIEKLGVMGFTKKKKKVY